MKKILFLVVPILLVTRSAYSQTKAASVSIESASTHLEVFAKFNGDITKYLSQQLIYPVTAQKQGHEGRVYVQFIIRTDGSIEDTRVIRSSGFAELDEEGIRVVNTMNRKKGKKMWTPAKNNGHLVSSYFTLPISFSLDK